jgi:hypothetical protein
LSEAWFDIPENQGIANRTLASAKLYGHSYILQPKRSKLAFLCEWILRWYRDSLLRLVLRACRSCYHRIRFERRVSGSLVLDEVRQSIPQVACGDSRNEMQFCTRSIQSLEQGRPYLTLADAELFLQGWFQADRWHAHLGSEACKPEQLPFSSPAGKARQSYAAPSNSATDQM